MMRYIAIAYSLLIVQELTAQQYPFVQYTPKDGLVNVRCHKAFQDSHGRMYFMTPGGLSVYDGSKFTNYTTEQGLCNNVVNDVYEAGPDSLLVATNANCINTLVRGKISILHQDGGVYPAINQFLKSQNGKVYLLADDGLFVLNNSQITREPILEAEDKSFKLLHQGIEWRNYLLMIPWESRLKNKIILYDKKKHKLLHTLTDPIFFGIAEIPGRGLIATTTKGQFIIDTSYLQQGKLHLVPAPPPFNRPDKLETNIYHAENGATWLYTLNTVYQYKKNLLQQIIRPEHQMINNISTIYIDRENILWVLTDGSGVYKFPNTDIQFFERSGDQIFSGVNSLYTSPSTDTVWLYKSSGKKLVYHTTHGTGFVRVKQASLTNNIVIKDGHAYLIGAKAIYRIPYPLTRDQSVSPALVHSLHNFNEEFGKAAIDPFGNLIVWWKREGDSHLAVFIGDKFAGSFALASFADGFGFDTERNLWVITRNNRLLEFRLHPDQPGNYFELLYNFQNDFELSEPRALLVDKFNGIWVGTRYNGLSYLKIKNAQIITHKRFSIQSGLTDNFVYEIGCDNSNNVWAATQNGIDKISWRDSVWIVENVTRSSNIFQTFTYIAVDKANTVWGITNTGNVIKINSRQPVSTKAPPLLFTSVKIDGKPLENFRSNIFEHDQNNITFSVAAASFIDEKSIQYSYLLTGEKWSEPGNSATFNFSNLAPSKYQLKVKASFPGSIYPPQLASYSFTILPPFWETWWFRAYVVFFIAILAMLMLRNYFTRKLQKEKLVLEKKQVIEKERTRIATDIHDDLGSGLSRIRYLCEMVKERTVQQQNILPHIEKISEFSDEMVDKMNEIVWALNQKNDSLAALLYYTRSFAAGYLMDNNLQCRVRLPDEIPVYIINAETRRNIFLAIKESLHNIVKHAGATEASISIMVNHNIIIEIQDNGRGINLEDISPSGNGLSNIKKRMEDVGGTVTFSNHEGARTKLIIPLS